MVLLSTLKMDQPNLEKSLLFNIFAPNILEKAGNPVSLSPLNSIT